MSFAASFAARMNFSISVSLPLMFSRVTINGAKGVTAEWGGGGLRG
jgi:hypothetical protein